MKIYEFIAPAGIDFATTYSGRAVHRVNDARSGFGAWRSVCGQEGDFHHGSLFNTGRWAGRPPHPCKRCWPDGFVSLREYEQ